MAAKKMGKMGKSVMTIHRLAGILFKMSLNSLSMVGMYVTHNKKQMSVYYVMLSVENLLYETFTIWPIPKIHIFDMITLPDC